MCFTEKLHNSKANKLLFVQKCVQISLQEFACRKSFADNNKVLKRSLKELYCVENLLNIL